MSGVGLFDFVGHLAQGILIIVVIVRFSMLCDQVNTIESLLRNRK